MFNMKYIISNEQFEEIEDTKNKLTNLFIDIRDEDNIRILSGAVETLYKAKDFIPVRNMLFSDDKRYNKLDLFDKIIIWIYSKFGITINLKVDKYTEYIKALEQAIDKISNIDNKVYRIIKTDHFKKKQEGDIITFEKIFSTSNSLKGITYYMMNNSGMLRKFRNGYLLVEVEQKNAKDISGLSEYEIEDESILINPKFEIVDMNCEDTYIESYNTYLKTIKLKEI